jgi:rhodanese-related sulfurtransferase
MRLLNLFSIVAVSLALAGYSAWVLAEREGDMVSSSGADVDGVPLLRMAEAEALWRGGSAVFLDVRSSTDYAYGHIAGAVHLPGEEIEERLPEFRSRLERATALVVYCGSENCGKSLWAALRLRKAGLARTKIYPAGLAEWDRHGLPITRTAWR